jgi:3-oxoadipate enol-lactonase
MPAINVSPGIKLYYSDLNSTGQQPVILLHGLGANGDSWAFQIPVLTKYGFRILIPDLRGFGKSTYSGGSHTVKDMAADVICLIDRLGISSSHVAGISMGGTIALQIAYEYPHRLQRLVLVNTFAQLRPNSIKHFLYFAYRIALVYSLGLPAQARYVTKRLFPNPEHAHLRQALMEQILQADPRGYRATIRALACFNITDHLADIGHQTLVITGEQDTTIPKDKQNYLAEKIPHACQVILCGAGHGITGEKPEEFNRELIRFLVE